MEHHDDKINATHYDDQQVEHDLSQERAEQHHGLFDTGDRADALEHDYMHNWTSDVTVDVDVAHNTNMPSEAAGGIFNNTNGVKSIIIKRRPPNNVALVSEQYQKEAVPPSPHNELAQVEKNGDNLEERLQLYSEIIALKKELAIVQEDEERLRQHLAETKRIIDEYDPETTRSVAILEDQIKKSSLGKLWNEEQADNLNKVDWSTIDIKDLKNRVHEFQTRFAAVAEKSDALYANYEAKINEHTDNREHVKTTMQEGFEEEMKNLGEARKHLQQVKAEFQYHNHRGTARVQDRNFISSDKKNFIRQRRVQDAETRTNMQVDNMNTQLTDLMEECKLLKKQLDETRRMSEGRKQLLENKLRQTEADGSEARELRKKMEKEEEELLALKTDLQGVLHYVRTAHREDDGF